MGSNTKSLLLGGSISIAVLLISIAMFVFNTATGTTNEAVLKITEQEVLAFNQKITLYEGEQNGGNIRSLIAQLISNANVVDKDDKLYQLPDLIVANSEQLNEFSVQDAQRPITIENISEYIRILTKTRNTIKNSDKYYIELEYASTGIIDKISILDVAK